MNEIAAVQAALTSIKAATDIAHVLRGSTTSLKDAETKYKLAELLNALADIRTELAAVQETIISKDRTIRELSERLTFEANMKFEAPYYWNVNAIGERDGPFCQPCWDEKKSAIRLNGRGNGCWKCMICEKFFTDSSHIPTDTSFFLRR